MVIASTNWKQNVSDCSQDKIMSATGILICHDNSYPFKKRTLSLVRPIKIGRSVARARAANDNAIFDCKVLSRNHALLWYDSGKFYIKDTKSSNGTFVNNKRLSPSGEESIANEVSSDDIVQFGVDVVESNKKVTHGCIVATLKLYLPDGNEAKTCISNYVRYVNVSFEDLHKLNQFIQEAGRRESALRSKLEYMQQLLEHTRIVANQSWKALVLEDCLLSRLETLQNQVISYSKNFGEDKLRIELIKLFEEKVQYQNATKELLQKKVQEKHEIIGKVQSLKCRLSENREEIQSLHKIIKQNQYELQDFAIKHVKVQQTLQDTNDKLNKTKLKLKEVIQQSEKDKQEYLTKLENKKIIERNLQISFRNAKSDKFHIYKQIVALKNYMQTLQDIKYITDDFKDNINSINTMDIILNKCNKMYVEILDNEIQIKNQPDTQIFPVNSEFSKSFFVYNNFIKKNQSNNLSVLKRNPKYMLPSVTNKTLLITNNILDSRNLSVMKTELLMSNFEKIFNFDKKTELSSQKINENMSVYDIQENFEEQEDNKSLKIVMNLFGNQSKSYIDKKILKNQVESQIDYRQFENLLQISLIRIINIAKEFNNIIDLNKNLLPDKNDSKIKQIYWQNDYIINFLKSIPYKKNDDSSAFNVDPQEFLLHNIMHFSNYLKRNENQSYSIVQDLQDMMNWHTVEPKNIILGNFKKYDETKNEMLQIQELSEQLVILKEKYTKSLEERSNIKRKYEKLDSQCKDFINTTYMVPVYYVAPIIFALIWMLLDKIM